MERSLKANIHLLHLSTKTCLCSVSEVHQLHAVWVTHGEMKESDFFLPDGYGAHLL